MKTPSVQVKRAEIVLVIHRRVDELGECLVCVAP